MESDERVSVVFDQCEQDLSMNWLRMKRYRGHQRHVKVVMISKYATSNAFCSSFSGSPGSQCLTESINLLWIDGPKKAKIMVSSR